MSRLIDRLRPRMPEQRAAGLVELFPTWASKDESPPRGLKGYVKGNGVVFATTEARAKVFSEIRFAWRRYRDSELWTNDALALFERPWPGGTASEMLHRMQQDAAFAGNSFIYRANKTTLQRLDPELVDVASNGLQKTGYFYYPNGRGREAMFLLPGEVAHWAPIPDPERTFVGMSWLQPIVAEIGSDFKMTRHQSKWYDQAATPNMIVKVESRLTADNRELLRSELDRKYGGWENAYKTMVLDGGADVKVVGADFMQMDFVNALAANESRVAMAGGVPPILIGLKAGLDAATYSNYGMAMRAFADHTIRPDWNGVVGALNQIADTPGGSELWYDDSQVAALKQDKLEEASVQSTDANTIRTLIDAGYDPDSAMEAVTASDMKRLAGQHSGLYSVQLQEPGTGEPDSEQEPPSEDEGDEGVA